MEKQRDRQHGLCSEKSGSSQGFLNATLMESAMWSLILQQRSNT